MAGSSSAGNRNSDFDVEDDDELRTSLLYDSERYHKKSYTKLEVISAKQIRAIIRTFHFVIIAAFAITILSVILCNHLFIVRRGFLLNSQLLTKEQKAKSRRLYPQSSAMGLNSTSVKTANGMGYKELSNINHRYNVWWGESSVFNHHQCFYRANGMHNFLSINVRGPRLNCAARNDPCYRHWSKFAVCNGGSENADDDDGGGVALAIPTLIRQKTSSADEPYLAYTLRGVVLPMWYVSLAQCFLFLGGLLVLLLATCFVIRLVRTGRRNISQEQIFACMLLFFSAFYFNIPTALFRLHTLFGGKLTRPVQISAEELPPWLVLLDNPLTALRINFIGPFFIFYLWANIHAFSVLDPKERLNARFFVPKILLIAPYCFIKLMAFFRSGITTSETPFISAIVLLHSYRGFRVWEALKTMCIFTIILTCFEFIFLCILIYQLVKTIRILQKAPYMVHRSKQIGFRFFVYLATVYIVTLYTLQIFLILARPVSEIVASDSFNFGVQFIGVRPEHCIGTIILTLMYVVISAFVNLPFDSIGFICGWFRGTELAPSSTTWSHYTTDSGKAFHMNTSADGIGASGNIGGPSSSRDPGGNSVNSRSGPKSANSQRKPTFIVDKDYELLNEVVEPFTYQERESNDSLELKANCFTMQTHVIMFNFAWFVYYYGTEKLENFKNNLSESVLPFAFNVSEGISSLETDTHALVVDGSDRIIVSFKGTTSKRNLRTSMKIYHEYLVNVVPTDIDGVNELERLRIVFGRVYDRAKIHKGFAAAYASVAHRVMRRIKKLHDERPRPVFLTGHSLGGALATICSLDIWIKLRISRRQILVSTFGSPRVGNDAFKRIYDSVIALHWRIVVDTDMIAKLPKGLYRHVGTKVLITPHGHMFIEPWELQLKLWSGSTAGLAYHRKASYLLAIRAWCVKKHKRTYMPAFWPFPVREDDIQRFDDELLSFDDENEGEHNGSGNEEERILKMRKNSAARRIMQRDTMVESLNGGNEGYTMAVEKWERMTRRLLLTSKLSETVSQPR